MRTTQIAVVAKAPVPGYAKTRLALTHGAQFAAQLQRSFIKHVVKTAVAAEVGAVSVWCAPDPGHPLFRAIQRHMSVDMRKQRTGSLGDRMLDVFEQLCPRGPTIVIGTDCPAMQPAVLKSAAEQLRLGADVVIVPAEDGGYTLIGLRAAQASLFRDIPWSTERVLSLTRRRCREAGLSLVELGTLWDVDTGSDVHHLATHLICRPAVREATRWPAELLTAMDSLNGMSAQ